MKPHEAATCATLLDAERHQAPGQGLGVHGQGGLNHASIGANGRRPPRDLALGRGRQRRGCGLPLSRALRRGRARAIRVLAGGVRGQRRSARDRRRPWNDAGPNGAIHRLWPCEASHRTRRNEGSPTTSMALLVRCARPRSTSVREACQTNAPCSTPPGTGWGSWVGGPDGHDFRLHFRYVLVRQRRAFVRVEPGRDAASACQGSGHLPANPLR